MDLPLLKKDITNNLESQKPAIYSRYRRNYRLVIWYYDVTYINDAFQSFLSLPLLS